MPETTPVTEMARCRFCGGPSYRHVADKDFHGGVAIGCATCGALGPMQDEADFDDDAAMWVAAEEAWNTATLSTRTPEAAQVWQSIETAPKDGTLVLLLVDYSGDDGDHWIDDREDGCGRTIGHNNDDNELPGEGDGWKFSGWCWTHDHYVEGSGSPILWQPLPEPPAIAHPLEKEG